MKIKLLTGIVLIPNLIFAQLGSSANTDSIYPAHLQRRVNVTGVFPKEPIKKLENFSISGYYRFITNVRKLDVAYAEQAKTPVNIFVGDDGQIPQLSLNMAGSVSATTRFSSDFYLWTPMMGGGMPENVKGLNLGVSLNGSHSTSYGNFEIQCGGINWYALSPFTFHTNQGYNRYSLFERNPWDPRTKNIDDRYNSFYTQGALNQDLRWGNQAFQGVIFEGNDLPNGFSTSIMFGKTQLNGGMMALPNQSYGGKLKKLIGTGNVTFNSFNNQSYTDSLMQHGVGFNIHTLTFEQTFLGLKISGETGAGRYFSPSTQRGWGEAISVKLNTPAKYTLIPLQFHYFQISPKVLNNSSVFWNSSIREGNTSSNNSSDQIVLAPFASALTQVGQITNNRKGFEINSEFEVKKFKFNLGYSNSREIENISSQLTYGHPVNGLALSRFWRWGFPANVGPYGNLTKVYRSVFETVNLTDVTPTKQPLNTKYFNVLEVNAKYRTKILNKDLYINYLGSYSSVQNFYSNVTVFTEKAYLRAYYHQLEAYLKLTKRVVWTNYAGWERIIANYDTEINAVTRRPRNQTGYGFATGLDIEMSKGAGLYLRQRWMDYYDSSFPNNKYSGWESTVEVKIFF